MSKFDTLEEIEIDEKMQEGLDVLATIHPISQEGILAIVVGNVVRETITEAGEEIVETSVYDAMGEFMNEVKEAKLTHEEIHDALIYFRQFIYLGANMPSSKKEEKEA